MKPNRLLLALAPLWAASCVTDLTPEVGPALAGRCENTDTDPEVEVSFSEDILPMLQSGCGCHDPAGRSQGGIDASGFSIGSHAEVVRGGNNGGDMSVVPGEPCESVLVQKCSEAPPFGARMPLYGPYFTREEFDLLHDWIAEGARDN